MDSCKDYVNSVNLKEDSDFPYLVLEARDGHIYPLNKGFRVMHWHEDLQFIYVLTGTVSVKTLTEEIVASAGQGVFINKRVVHLISYTGSGHYYNFLFPDYFLGFYTGCPARGAVDKLSGNGALPVYCFNGDEGWHLQALGFLHALAELEQAKTDVYCYAVMLNLCSLWLVMLRHIKVRTSFREKPLHQRMRTFLKYMEEHYNEDISLGDLAGSANVSKSECLRCFKQSVQVTPYQYLIEMRLAKAALLLRQTDAPVSVIAARVGFQQSSHFGKFFKAKTGFTPLTYRKQKN